MDDAAVLSVLSKCFAPADEAEWKHLTESSAWSEFLDGARQLMQGTKRLGRDARPIERAHRRCPLQDFLSAGEVDALFCPPTYEEKRRFAARHFTGGLPESALPVESLYTAWSGAKGTDNLFGKAEGMYLGQSARYMEALAKSLGCEIPAEFAGCPDHLALELDMAAVLVRSGMADEACTFLGERFGWLTAYRIRLLSLSDDARFYIGLVDVLLGICAEQAPEARIA